MIVTVQKPIWFVNKAEVIVDKGLLEMAMLWWADYFYGKPIAGRKVIFLHGKYPGVAIFKDKIHVHRLIYCYITKKVLRTGQHVHHKDGNKLNSILDNLELLDASFHQSITNKGRKQTAEWVNNRITKTANAKRGKKYPKRIYENPDLLARGVNT